MHSSQCSDDLEQSLSQKAIRSDSQKPLVVQGVSIVRSISLTLRSMAKSAVLSIQLRTLRDSRILLRFPESLAQVDHSQQSQAKQSLAEKWWLIWANIFCGNLVLKVPGDNSQPNSLRVTFSQRSLFCALIDSRNRYVPPQAHFLAMKSTISYRDAKAPQALPTDPIEPLPDHHRFKNKTIFAAARRPKTYQLHPHRFPS